MVKKLVKMLIALMVLTIFAGTGINVYADDTKVYTDSQALLNDFRDETIHFVITTRFYDGDNSNNVYCWDGTAINEGDEPWRGDFKGLIDKLDYIKALGFTAVWITPVVKNASGYDYHGYHAINFKEVDKRYESDDCTYQDLIDAVHEHGMKIIQDVVFNHTGNFGEENLYPIFQKDDDADPSNIDECMIPNYDYIPQNYASLQPADQYYSRLNNLKNLDGNDNDKNNIYHHNGDFNWDDYTCQISQIAGDCVDLNTENPKVYKYLVEAYGQYIKMGVDAFRVDTVRHISRLTLNKGFITQLNDIYNDVHGTTGEGNFYMFGEVCTRYTQIWYREVPALSTPFYTWKESKEYAWIDDENDPDAYITNMASAEQHYNDNDKDNISEQPVSDNAFLKGNDYHTPDHSQASGLNVIDFPMHWNFKTAKSAFNLAKSTDQYYNDATYNVVYVDSHDYAPDHAPEDQRFAGDQATWAENLDLMFTFRGIPCIYYGSEVEFQKGKTIDKGTLIALADSGRAYFGDYIEGNVDTVDFAAYTNASGKMKDTLEYPLSLHIQRLNRLRAKIPALRKGQYSVNDITYSGMAFKRRYTDENTDSFVLVTISGNATFNNIPNGRYVDAITGSVKNVKNNTLTAECSKKADMRVYVLNTELTPAPGVVAGKSVYLSGGKDVVIRENPVTSIVIEGTDNKVEIGETLKLKTVVTPINATGRNITWTSSDNSIASVSDGKVTPKKAGTVTIYATTQNGLTANTTVTVTATGVQAEKVILDKTEAELTVGDETEFVAQVLPEDAANKDVTWKSSDSGIVRVKDGKVSAKSVGTAVITATCVNGTEASAVVTVKSKVIDGDVMYFEKPDSWGSSINCYIWKDDYKNNGWPGVRMEQYSDNVYVISYPEGMEDLNVIFNDGGNNQTKDLKASINGYYDKNGLVREETAERIDVSEVNVDQSEIIIDKGDDVKVAGSVLPENATNKKLSWTTADKNIAVVDENGNISGVGTGTTYVYATANNGVKTTIEVSVKGDEPQAGDNESKLYLYSFTSDASENGVLVGGKVKFTANAQSTTDSEIQYRFYYTKDNSEVELADFSTENSVSVDFDKTGKYDICVEVKDSEGNISKAVISGFEVYNEVPDEEPTDDPEEPETAALKVKTFKTGKASGKIKTGQSTTFSAAAEGGTEKYTYRFAYKYNGKVTKLGGYSDKASVKWKAPHSGKYTLYVYVKDSEGKTAKKTISNYKVAKRKISISSFKISKKSGKVKKNDRVGLTVKATGGYGKLKYKFVYKLNGKTVAISKYASSKTADWKIKKSGTYKLYVYVKDSDGSTAVKCVNKFVVK